MNIVNRPELLEQIAASYALGTLRGGARRRFETLAREHVTARAQALIWQERLASITELQQGEAPSANVWKRIANAVEHQRSAAAVKPAAPVADTSVADRLRRALGLWRGGAVVAGAVALVAVLTTFNLGRQIDDRDRQLAGAKESQATLLAQMKAMPDIQYVAVLADDKAANSFLVTFDPNKQTLMLKRLGGYHEADDRSLQLWALPGPAAEGAKPAGPRSLGVLGGDAVIKLTAAPGAVRDAPALAVSLEPKGGVPGEGGPTGPVMFKGALLSTAI